MKYRFYNKRFFTISAATLLFIASLNIFVDPYNIFNTAAIKRVNYYKPDVKRQERLTKFLNLKTFKKVDTIFVGISRTDWSLETEYYNKITNKIAVNMAVAAADFNEIKEIIFNSLKIHPEIKTVLLAVDIQKYMPMITEKVSFNVNVDSSKITANEIASVVFSMDTTVSSIITLIKNICGVEKRVFLQNGMKHIFYNKEVVNSFEGTLNKYKDSGKCFETTEINLTELKLFVDELKLRGVDVVLYIPPLHITLMEVYDYNNSWPGVEEFKKELARVQPFYDFMYVHKINTEKISPDMKYYFESSHSTYLAGEKILDKIFNNNGDYGVLVTLENVNKHNKINRNKLKLWQMENPVTRKWVHETLNKK